MQSSSSYMFYVIAAVLLAVLIFYVSYYYRHPTELTILQTTLRNFTFDILREKQPVVIQDHLVALSDLAKLWFSFNKVTEFDLGLSSPDAPVWICNKYKYAVVQAGDADMEVLISHASSSPADADAAVVAIQLKEGQAVIVPLHAHYAVCRDEKESANVHCLGVHDAISRWLP